MTTQGDPAGASSAGQGGPAPQGVRAVPGVGTGTGFWQDARARSFSPGARKWRFGSLWGLIYLVIPVVLAWASGSGPLPATLMTILVVVIGALYVALPPLVWNRPWPLAAVAYGGFFLITCLAFPLYGIYTIWLWMYVPIMAAMSWLRTGFIVVTIVTVVVAQLIVLWATGTFLQMWYSAALTASISIMMLTFGQQIRTIARLRDAQGEIARLAVVDERERFARDMHDVLGHSLTVVTVKSELARKLLARDPARAEAELNDIERLSRAALADLRASVAGYRAMTLDTELSAAHAALVAADVVPHLPASTDVVSPELRETFAWVLRESVTNVVRHAKAKNCWVALEKRAIIIGDDGRGMPVTASAGAVPTSGGDGHGLEGMRERAAKVSASVTIGPGDDGGTIVAVRAASVTGGAV
ncbi:sensor histidine kinase [Humibacter antri]